jgi:HlyD family type I secretion membrane fusion protein
VEEGQTLVTLDPTVATADLEQLREKQQSLTLQELRLNSELGGEPFVPPPGYPVEDLALQQSIYDRRKREFDSRIQSWERQTAEIKAEMRTMKDSVEQVRRQLAMSKEIDEIYDKLFEEGVSTRLEALSAKSQRFTHESEIERLRNRIREQQEELNRILADREAFVSNWISQAYQELLEVRRELDEVGSQVEKAEWYSRLVELKSPQAGIVLDMAKLSGGSVIDRAEPLLTLVPEGAEILAEVEVLNRDIGYIRTGDEVRIKLDAFPFQEHGILQGKVATISEDSFSQEGGYDSKVYYRVRIALETTQLQAVPDDFRLIPGMSMTA